MNKKSLQINHVFIEEAEPPFDVLGMQSLNWKKLNDLAHRSHSSAFSDEFVLLAACKATHGIMTEDGYLLFQDVTPTLLGNMKVDEEAEGYFDENGKGWFFNHFIMVKIVSNKPPCFDTLGNNLNELLAY